MWEEASKVPLKVCRGVEEQLDASERSKSERGVVSDEDASGDSKGKM